MDNMVNLFKKGGIFSTKGRMGRKKFMLSFIAMVICLLIIMFLVYVAAHSGSGMLVAIAIIALALPLVFFSISIHVRRLHDLNKSGWWFILIWMINSAGTRMDDFNPFDLISILIFIYMCAKRGTVGENQYGNDPIEDKQA